MRCCTVGTVAESIVLIGMMGAGKSSVGRCLQRRTKFAFVDTDESVSSSFGISIGEIFSRFGEEKFRESETQALQQALKLKPAIIVTGGGIVSREENLKILKRLGVIVWLDGSDDVLFERALRSGDRPLLQTKHPREAFARLLQTRRRLYEKVADLWVDTSLLTDEEVAVTILTKLKKLAGSSPRRRSRRQHDN